MLQHQQLSSPARLGLANPNSPSIPLNPNVNPKPHLSSGASSAVLPAQSHNRLSTTSSVLLPLLPPLARAQSLLIQMSALATKLFEVSPNRSSWVSAYRGALPTFLAAPAQGLAAAPELPPVSSTKEALSLFASLQTQMVGAVSELQEILNLQDAKTTLAEEIRSKDITLLAFAKKIKEAHQVLDLLVDDYSDYRRSNRSKRLKTEDLMEVDGKDSAAEASFLSLSNILSYAHRISYTTFAPPEFGAGQAPLRGALPPAPQDEQMRASQLYQFADLDMGLPKDAEAKDKAMDSIVSLVEPTPPREENLPSLPPALPPITVPPGWKKGMPIDLPVDLPPMPPGWKPGDPIPLPPLDAFRSAEKMEDQKAVAPPPAIPAQQIRQPEPIQVKYVQLDINPEDDYSSDYSSDGSSDEDDED